MSRLLILSLVLVAIGARGDAQSMRPSAPCGSTPPSTTADADADLYCIDLLPPAAIDGPSGTARLVPPASPFGIAVTPAGDIQYDIVFTLGDLPAPASLGAYTSFVAWA